MKPKQGLAEIKVKGLVSVSFPLGFKIFQRLARDSLGLRLDELRRGAVEDEPAQHVVFAGVAFHPPRGDAEAHLVAPGFFELLERGDFGRVRSM